MPRPAHPSTTVPAASSPQEATRPEVRIGWLQEHIHRADVPYRMIVVALAFLLGSFVAANPDVWTTLATGRLLAEGEYTFGVDPFSYMTEAAGRRAVAWINHSWLYSWICYLLYGDNGTVLVVAKALCLAVLAFLMLRARPNNRHGWAGTWCVLLAIIVVGTQALLQPIVVSFVFLAATLLILYQGGILCGEEEKRHRKLLWLLPIMFAFWVNLDAWFVVGFWTLCLVWVGAKKPASPSFAEPRYSWIVAASLLACLANPYHFRALATLPPELSYLLAQTGNFWPESLVAGSTMFRYLGGAAASPVSKNFWLSTTEGGNVAGGSFVVLFLSTAASFYFCRPSPRRLLIARALLAGFFGLLALTLAKLMAWFGIVGGLVLMWNVQEYLALRERTLPAQVPLLDRWANAARLAMGFALFGLLFLAWPGWVNSTIGDYASTRRVAWTIEEDPSLKKAAQFLLEQHEKGSLGRGFNTSPDLAAYCAFHAPRLKMFMDQRAALFDRVLPVYTRIRKGLDEETQTNPINAWGSPAVISFGKSGWREDLSRNRVDYIAGTDLIARKLMLWTLRFPVGELETIYADGKTYIIAWNRDAKDKNRFKDKGEEISERWREEVFGAHENPWPKPIPSLPPLAGDPGFWSLYLFGQRKPSAASLEGNMLLEVHEELTKAPPWTPFYECAGLAAYWTLPAAFPAGSTTGLCALTTFPLVTMVAAKAAPASGSDLGSPAALLLCVRTAHRALAQDPEDADCYRLLVFGTAQIQHRLEGFWTRGETGENLRTRLRKCQFVSALQQYLLLNRRDFEAHWQLGSYFYREGCYDLAVKHLDEAVKLIGQEPALKELRTMREDQLVEVRMEQSRRMSEFTLRSAQASDLEKVAMAAFSPFEYEDDGRLKVDPRGMGLQGKAWEILSGLLNRWSTLSDAEQHQAADFYVPLALNLGYLPQVDKIIRGAGDAKPRDLLFLATAEFDFRRADEALSALADAEERELQKRASSGIAGPIAMLMSPAGLPASPVLTQLALVRAGELNSYQAAQAELHGLFALDAGKTLSARRYFEASLRLSASAGAPFPEGKIARRYLQLLK